MKSDIVDIDGRIKAQTPQAILLEYDEEAEAVWLPRSQIEIDTSATIAVVSMPKWLAIEKGLV